MNPLHPRLFLVLILAALSLAPRAVNAQNRIRAENEMPVSSGTVYGWNGERRSGTYATTIYTAKKGNFVFNASTCWWNMLLSTPPGFMNPPKRYFLQPDARIQQITKNVLDKLIATDVVAR